MIVLNHATKKHAKVFKYFAHTIGKVVQNQGEIETSGLQKERVHFT